MASPTEKNDNPVNEPIDEPPDELVDNPVNQDQVEIPKAAGSESLKRKEEFFHIDEQKNTYVYVNGLPNNTTEDEFIDLMKKYGIIAKKTNHSGNPFNIKMYKDKDGNFKGDAWCCYARVESAELAVELLNEYLYDQHHLIHCEKAKFQMKGEYDPSKKPKFLDKKNKAQQKKKLEKLLSWEPKPEVKQKKVIVKYMFTPQELDEGGDEFSVLTIKEDVEQICADIIEPKRVDVYDKHPDGVVAVTFAETEQAEEFIKTLEVIKFYNQHKVVAELWDGKTKYKIKETEEEERKRLEKWHEDLKKSDDEAGNEEQLDQDETKKSCDKEDDNDEHQD